VSRRYRRKRYYPTGERILIHLSMDGRTSAPRLEARTQDGIAAATFSGRPTVTKWLLRLEDDGFVTRERAEVPGYPLPKYVYRLSEEGALEAERLQARLASETVEVHNPSLGTLTMRVADVPALASPGLDLTAAVSLVREGELDLANLPRQRSTLAEPLVWGESLRQVDHLFGREWEMRALDAWYASPSKVLLVTGLAGIGKSTLVAEWVQRRRPRAHVFQFQMHRGTKPTALLANLGAFLAALGRRHLASRLSEEAPLDLRLVLRLLRRELAKVRILVILDGFEQASRDVALLLRKLLLELVKATPLKLVLLSRNSPGWFSSTAGEAPPFEVLRLRGLDHLASAALLRAKGLKGGDTLMRDLADRTRGHPLLLHLVAQGGRGKISAVSQYLEEEVWAALTRDERGAIESASAFRRPVPGRVLEAATGVRHGVLVALRAKNLLEQTVTNGYFAHDLVRDFVHDHTTEAKRRGLHARAAKPLLLERNPRERWEGVFHLLASGRHDEAATYLDSVGSSLVDSIAAAEVASLLRGLPLDRMSPAASLVFSEMLGDSLRILGHIGPALYQYSYARRVAEAGQTADRIPRLLRKMAFLERCRNHYPRALGYLVEALARIGPHEKLAERGEILRETALVEEALGELAKAAGNLNEAIDLATETSDQVSLSRALLALGSLETRRGFGERGLDYCLEALRIAERSGNLTELAHAHIVVGTTLTEIQRHGESLRHYETGLELARSLGNLRLTAYATMNRAAALLNLERYREVGRVLREAEGYFGILEERDTLALLKTYEGQREMGLGRWGRATRAWQEGIESLREYGTPSDLALVLKEVASFHVAHGDLEEARKYLLEAKQYARRLGSATLISEIGEALSRAGGHALTRVGS